jgi:hypothetical protein
MIPLRDQEFIRQRFAEDLVDKVRIDFFTQRDLAGITVPGQKECLYCKPTGEMLSDLARLTDKIDLRTHYLSDKPAAAQKYGVERVPAIVVGAKSGRWFTFYGIPGGNEFPNFIESIISASRDDDEGLDADVKKELKRLKEDVYLQVFVTPT